jgi:antirestriction protein ArdC
VSPRNQIETAFGELKLRPRERRQRTRHPSRLNRDFGRKRFADAGYAMEELVAEIGAAFLCADLGITPETRTDHAAYIASWLKLLKDDKRAIFTAASHAQKAADYLHGLQSWEAQS